MFDIKVFRNSESMMRPLNIEERYSNLLDAKLEAIKIFMNESSTERIYVVDHDRYGFYPVSNSFFKLKNVNFP